MFCLITSFLFYGRVFRNVLSDVVRLWSGSLAQLPGRHLPFAVWMHTFVRSLCSLVLEKLYATHVETDSNTNPEMTKFWAIFFFFFFSYFSLNVSMMASSATITVSTKTRKCVGTWKIHLGSISKWGLVYSHSIFVYSFVWLSSCCWLSVGWSRRQHQIKYGRGFVVAASFVRCTQSIWLGHNVFGSFLFRLTVILTVGDVCILDEVNANWCNAHDSLKCREIKCFNYIHINMFFTVFARTSDHLSIQTPNNMDTHPFIRILIKNLSFESRSSHFIQHSL